MAIALPLIIELFHGLDRAVQWLSGGSAAPDHQDPGCTGHPEHRNRSGAAHRVNPPHRSDRCLPDTAVRCLAQTAPKSGSRQWREPIGPLRLHPARKGWRPAAPGIR